MKKITLKFEKDFLEFKQGQTVEIHVDVNGTPIEKRFRKLLNDSKIDGTVQIQNAVKESKIESEKKVKKQKAEAKADAKTDSEK